MVVVVENNDGKDDEDMPYFEYRQADARAELELAEDAALPYVELIDEHWEFPLYVFMDKEGMKQIEEKRYAEPFDVGQRTVTATVIVIDGINRKAVL